MRWLFGTVLALALMVGEAHAACEGAYTGAQLGEDIGRMTTALRALDEKTFMDAGTRMEANLSCVRNNLPDRLYASAYRFIGATHFFKGDIEGAKAWFRTSLELAPEFYWDAGDLDIAHPMRTTFDAERNKATGEPVALEGKQITEMAGSYLTLDGRRLEVAEATLDRPHFLAVVSESDNTVRQVILIQGNAIPEQFLEDAAAEPEVQAADEGKKGKKNKDSGEEVVDNGLSSDDPMNMFAEVKVKRVRPAAKTPLMISGGVITVAAAGLYGASFATHGQFEDATTTSDLESARDLTNLLVVASGATLAVGLSVGYVGIMMDGTPGLRIGGRF